MGERAGVFMGHELQCLCCPQWPDGGVDVGEGKQFAYGFCNNFCCGHSWRSRDATLASRTKLSMGRKNMWWGCRAWPLECVEVVESKDVPGMRMYVFELQGMGI